MMVRIMDRNNAHEYGSSFSSPASPSPSMYYRVPYFILTSRVTLTGERAEPLMEGRPADRDS